MSASAPQSSTPVDWARVRADFPLLQRQVHGKPLVYLDSANTGQKPACVIDAVDDFYRRHNANVSRAVHQLGAEATSAYEGARSRLARFLNVRGDELVLCSGTTFAINLVAYSWALPRLQRGDVILLTRLEHHANIVPWQLVAERTGAVVRVAEITPAGELDLDALWRAMTPEVKLLGLAHVSNVLGTVNPVREVCREARRRGIVTVVDGSQAVPHRPVDVAGLGCDFYAFTGHKMCGPTGTGALWGRREHLAAMPPFLGGGEMIREVCFEAPCTTTRRTASRPARPTSPASSASARRSTTCSRPAWRRSRRANRRCWDMPPRCCRASRACASWAPRATRLRC
jgi:cysteine desulfurase/selenocysteine lyase